MSEVNYIDEIEKLVKSIRENYMEADKMCSISTRIWYLLLRIRVEGSLCQK